MKIDRRRGGERGTDIYLTGDEVAQAIFDYLEKCKVTITGARALYVNDPEAQAPEGGAHIFVNPDEGSVEVEQVSRAELVDALKDAICFMKDAQKVSIKSKAFQLEALVDAYDRDHIEY